MDTTETLLARLRDLKARRALLPTERWPADLEAELAALERDTTQLMITRRLKVGATAVDPELRAELETLFSDRFVRGHAALVNPLGHHLGEAVPCLLERVGGGPTTEPGPYVLAEEVRLHVTVESLPTGAHLHHAHGQLLQAMDWPEREVLRPNGYDHVRVSAGQYPEVAYRAELPRQEARDWDRRHHPGPPA